jgi:hypothetical protein
MGLANIGKGVLHCVGSLCSTRRRKNNTKNNTKNNANTPKHRVRAASPVPAHIIAREEKRKANMEAEQTRKNQARRNKYYEEEAAARALRWANQNERTRRMAHNRGNNLRTLQERINTSLEGIKKQGSKRGMLGNSYVANNEKTIRNAQRNTGRIYKEYGVTG